MTTKSRADGFAFLNFSRENLRGFTLIETLLVIGVVGLLASIVLVAIGNARQQSRDSQRQANLHQITTSMELDFQENTQYLSTTGGVDAVTSISTYLPVVPKDPKNVAPCRYAWFNNTTNLKQYCVYTCLETVTNGYICASEKGTLTKVYATGAPALGACCY